MSDWSSAVCSSDRGGIATPLIASWPAGIDAKVRGTMVREPGHLVDVMPTLVELAGAEYPARFDGHDIRPMSGRSFAGAFEGELLIRSVPKIGRASCRERVCH